MIEVKMISAENDSARNNSAFRRGFVALTRPSIAPTDTPERRRKRELSALNEKERRDVFNPIRVIRAIRG